MVKLSVYEKKANFMDFDNGVPFDPGYSQHTYMFSENIGAVDNIMSSIKAPHQRKFQFKVFCPKIIKLFENSTAFYLGCLLWGTYIKQNFSGSPKVILNNNFLDKEINEEETFFEINFMIDYFAKFEKDCKYYLGKYDKLPDKWYKILTVYKEFLKINNNFKCAKSTNDIKLPSQIKSLSAQELGAVFEKIESVTQSGKLEELLPLADVLLD